MINVNKYSILGILVRTFKLSCKIFTHSSVLLAYAAVLAVIGLLFGYWGYYCQNGSGMVCYSITGSPYTSVGLYLWLALFLYFYLTYVYDFYETAFCAKPFKISQVLTFSKAKGKAALVVFAYILVFIVPVLVITKVLAQPAYPDWRIEMLNFTLIFSLFMLQLFMIRTIAALSYYLKDKKYPSLRQLYDLTSGAGYVSIILFLIILAFSLLTYMIIAAKLNGLGWGKTSFIGLYCIIFLSHVLRLFYESVLIAFCRAQHELLQPDEALDDEVEVESNDNNPAIVANETVEVVKEQPTEKKRTTKRTTGAKKKTDAAKKTKETAAKKRQPAKKRSKKEA